MNRQQATTLDDVPLGWRHWSVYHDRLLLYPPHHYNGRDNIWREPQPIYSADVPPTPRNGHGIHAITRGPVDIWLSKHSVSGIVCAQPGRVVKHKAGWHKRGWRAERVSIVALVGLPCFHDRLAQRYGVPLLWIPEAEAMLSQSGATVRVETIAYGHLWIYGNRLCQLMPPDDLVALRDPSGFSRWLESDVYHDSIEIRTCAKSDFLEAGRAMIAQAGLDPDAFRMRPNP